MSSPHPDTTRPQAKRIKKSDKTETPDPKNQSKSADHIGDNNDEVPEWLAKPPFQVGKDWKGWDKKWRSSCWCGKTAFSFASDPLQVKICHCEDCQRLHGAPFQMAAVFKKDDVRLDSTAEWLGFLSAHGEVHPLAPTPTPLPHKLSCRACGTPLFDEGKNMIMAFPPTFEWPRTLHEAGKEQDHHEHGSNGGEKTKDDAFDEDGRGRGKKGLPEQLKAQTHIFYERRVLDIKDGLPKWRGHKDDSEQMGETDE